MLSEDLDRVRRNPLPAVLVLLGGMLAGLFAGNALATDEPHSTPTTTVVVERPHQVVPEDEPRRSPRPKTPATDPAMAAQSNRSVDRKPDGGEAAAASQTARRAVEAAKQAVARTGLGELDAAIMTDRASAPVATSSRLFRAWSISKVFTAVALLEEGVPASAVEGPLTRSLTQSDNCAQRTLTFELQRQTGGTAGAQEAIRATFFGHGANIDVPSAAAVVEDDCSAELDAGDRGKPVLQLGTSTWTLRDAAIFMHALRSGRYPSAGPILERMREPKSDPPRVDAQLTADPAWGVGRVFPGVPYKGGWGGSETSPYVAAQVAAVPLGSSGRWAAIALLFDPATEPPDNDPGKAGAPQALQTGLVAMRPYLAELGSR